MIVISIRAVCVYLDSIEADVLRHLLDACIKGVLYTVGASCYGPELLFGRHVCAIESRLLTPTLFIMRRVYLHRREKIVHCPNDVTTSTHGQRRLTYCEDIFVHRWPIKSVLPDTDVYLIPVRRGKAENLRNLSHFSIASFVINQPVLPCP